MAHELKTPLTMVEQEVTGALKRNEIQPANAQRILSEVMEASEVVSSFLDWAEIEGATTNSKVFMISAEKKITEIQQRLGEKHPNRIQIKIAKNFHVLCGFQHFEHVILNLLQNALKYSPNTQSIELISREPFKISIIDHGPGIPQKVIDRLGEPFNRGENISQEKGNGLGLAYVKSICRLYSWKFSIQTSPNGSEFSMEFPMLHDEATDS